MASRIFVGHISSHVREKDIERFFRNYGHIREIMLKNGYGFVEFDDHRDAEDAIYELNGKDLCGDRVTIQHARGTARGGGRGRGRGQRRYDRYGPPVHTDYRLTVENLSSRMSWQDLKDYMRRAGEVTYADAHSYRRNEGVVEFATYSDLKNALEKFDNAEINGRKIKLVEDKPKRRQSRSRSRSRSRGRGRRNWSRSRSPSKSRSRSRSRSRSHDRSRSRSRSQNRNRSQNKSKSRSHSRSRTPKSRSRTPKSRSRSRSRSPSPSKAPTKDASAPNVNGDNMSDRD